MSSWLCCPLIIRIIHSLKSEVRMDITNCWLIFLLLEPSIFALSQWLASVQFNGTDAFMHQSLTVQIFKGENIESKKYLRRTLCKRPPSQIKMAELLKIEILFASPRVRLCSTLWTLNRWSVLCLIGSFLPSAYPILHVEEGKGDQGEEDGGQEPCLGVRLWQPGNLATIRSRWAVDGCTSYITPLSRMFT